MEREERHVLIGTGRGIAPERELGTQYFRKQGVPLAPQHMIIAPGPPGFSEEGDELGHQERVNAVSDHFDRCVMGIDKVHDPAI